MTTAESFFKKHSQTLNDACKAITERGHWSPFPEIPSGKIYGENARQAGFDDYAAHLNQTFILKGPESSVCVGSEVSPYSGALGVTYGSYRATDLVESAQEAQRAWQEAGPEMRTGVCIEILMRLNARSFEIGNATMHTTGQGFAMAFQAGGPHAQDRGLEAIAAAWLQTNKIPTEAVWEKPQGKQDPVLMQKRYFIVPKGVALVVACSTFPTWNTYPGLFASLVTGNPVIIKPHSNAILPVAITVQVAQAVLEEAGFDPRLVQLAAEDPNGLIAKDLAMHKAVKIIDYTGGNFFGDWLSKNALQAKVYKEQAGVNTVLIDSVESIKRVVQNLAFSISLYSGQMCTSPQAVLIPRDGIQTADGVLSFTDVVACLNDAIKKLLADPERAAGVLGAIPNQETIKRLEGADNLGEVVLESETHPIPGYEGAIYRTPLVLKVEGNDTVWQQEYFGPISFAVAIDNTQHGLDLIAHTIETKGAITFSVYSTSEDVLDRAEQVAIEKGVALSCNLDAAVFVNQSAAFSDFHATGNNPAANASLTDPAFVAERFAVVQSRRHIK